MSSLIHPVHSISQKCRPKHQVLVLKCYPKYQKGIQEVKPSSSELSYLLYYASSRRSKLQKVGAFLEKKTASDVYMRRLGNVQVTLQILTAVIEKTPRDLMLYSHSVLTIIGSVLRSHDINMVEESLPTLEAFCKHANSAALSADQQRIQQYLTLLELYSEFADPRPTSKARANESKSQSLRWRTAGLRAIRAVVSSDALNADPSKQLNTAVPVILSNMSLDDASVLSSLQQRARNSEKQENEQARRRRLSSATITTVDTTGEHQLTASETAADADKAAEDEVKVLAVRCLKQIFSVGTGSTRGQTRLATGLTLKFIVAQNPPKAALRGASQGNWATALFETIARWTPVQDRFIIVITAMETMIRSPIVESLLEKQLVVATLIDWLLSSDINLIGLSVMDIMLGFVQHTLLLLQLGGRDSLAMPNQPQTDTLGFIREAKETFDPSFVLSDTTRGRLPNIAETTPSPARQELLACLRKCIASLSNHIYYTEQVSDMMATILARLKPSTNSEIPSIAAAIEQPAAATRSIADSASLREDSSTDSFFSFATARVVALQTVRDILLRASGTRTSSGSSIESRTRVGVQVWEGTQWLLKDEDAEVRAAYIEALLAWVRLETNKNDLLLPKDGLRRGKSTKRTSAPDGEQSLSKRAVSNASRREHKPARSTFVQLLHLAAYDSILDRASNECEVLMLYLLLTKLVERLGVNALRTGLPMILKLQETALNGERDLSSNGKVNVASLIHGYLWSVAEKFEFEANKVGHEVNAEISRRKRFSIWLEKVKFPALSLHSIEALIEDEEKTSIYSEDAVGGLRPFLNVTEFVDEIAASYDAALLSANQSPPSSPGRVFSVQALGFGYGYGVAPGPKPSPQDQLPQKIKDEMGASWTRESCIAAAEKESTGSMTGASSGPRHHLSVHRNDSVEQHMAPEPSPAYGIMGGLGSLQKIRKSSANGSSPLPLSSASSRDSTLKVTELKRVLSSSEARQASSLRRPVTGSRRSTLSAGSDSLVSWNEADDQERSEDLNAAVPAANGVHKTTSRPGTSASKVSKAHLGGETTQENDQPTPPHGPGQDVPPVPKIPPNFSLPGTYPRDASPTKTAPSQPSGSPVPAAATSPQAKRMANSSQASPSLRGDRSTKRSSRPVSRATANSPFSLEGRTTPHDKVDVGSLLASIRPSTSAGNVRADNSRENEKAAGAKLSTPPY
ncbi:uncharacterized protein HMPREF1541_01087 [Cyphellophora europaea CBS 101466]|uniref:Protein EFR3 n=1 Tax=Cyphellophora europaea (strain CBS 101466) TaxID=1220924 RepID=W2SFY0_CYPE1|nr:uncharacterized protein HMPREF1541_01087 [Cyphellophora europaea CBS 101466]ETN46898.1 hypothetical protein HMPREF1541_01087 [Cyphellophora europaea CBS 101466]